MSVSMDRVDVLTFAMTLLVHFTVLAMLDTHWIVMERIVLVSPQDRSTS